ncbi:MAG: hypothetical protein LBP33_08030 [Candidatus Adiutrix sp.]|jgi:phosphate transport system permease protein|nr:hypothetical protein [Candidatus Adiutrix sp.]
MRRAIYFFSGVGLIGSTLLFAAILAGLVHTLGQTGPDILPAVFSLTWNPAQGAYGLLPMISSSIMVALLALVMALPTGFGLLWSIWVYDNRYSLFLRNLLRFMAGIPTVVYGLCGLFILVPFMRGLGAGNGFSLASVSLVLSVLILPPLVLTADSAVHNLMKRPETLTLNAGALGLGRDKAFLYIAVHACRRQIAAGLVLAFGRALGDTLIALMISGNAPVMPKGLFSSLRVLPAHINLLTAVEIDANIELTLFLSGFLLMTAAVGMSLLSRMAQK